MTLHFKCPKCGQAIRAKEKDSGRTFACPKCKGVQQVPWAEPEDAPPAHETREIRIADYRQPEHAPLMKPRADKGHEDLIDMTAMVDIVFFLLIFFLTTSFKQLDSAIDVPLTSAQKGGGMPQSTPTDGAPKGEITVNIDKADHITIDGAEMRSMEELYLKLRELRSGPGRLTSMMVVGSGDATHGTLVNVLDTAQEVGLAPIRLTVKEEGVAKGAK